jgi:hypothetical protein
MTGVTLGQGMVPVLLLVVHGHVHPIGGSGCHDWGSPWLTILLEGYTCPSGEAEVSRGGRALLMTSRGLRRGREMSSEALISPETSLQGSGGWSLSFRATSNCHVVCAFGESILLGPLRWGFNNRIGCRISPSVWYPGILIPNTITYDHRRIPIIIEKSISRSKRQVFKFNRGLRGF